MKKHVRNTQYRGFTLVELLVVIAIIFALAAISAPAVTKVLQRVALMTSVSNARQVKMALDSFAADFDGDYINDSTLVELGGVAASDAAGNFEALFLGNYLDDSAYSLFYSKELKNLLGATAHSEFIADGSNTFSNTNCGFTYNKGLSTTSDGDAPLLTTKTTTAGTFYSGLWNHKAVVARVDGSVKPVKLDGAPVKNPTSSDVAPITENNVDIFSIGSGTIQY